MDKLEFEDDFNYFLSKAKVCMLFPIVSLTVNSKDIMFIEKNIVGI